MELLKLSLKIERDIALYGSLGLSDEALEDIRLVRTVVLALLIRQQIRRFDHG
jgi:hypothetical protein